MPALPVLLLAACLVAAQGKPGKPSAGTVSEPTGVLRSDENVAVGERFVVLSDKTTLRPCGAAKTVQSSEEIPNFHKYLQFQRQERDFRFVVVRPSAQAPVPLLLKVVKAIQEENIRFVLGPAAAPGQRGIRVIPYGYDPTRPRGAQIGPIGGLSTGPTSRPTVRFMDTEGSAYHVVYVVDRSGSMSKKFGPVREELFRSIGALAPSQSFHVIFFSAGQPTENPPRRLVPATMANKAQAARYLAGIRPWGSTDAVPALKRAFDVLEKTPGGKAGKLIYLLTDAEFSNPRQVLKVINTRNKNRQVVIHTILYSRKETPKAAGLLQRIAADNRGRYRHVKTR